MRQALTLIVVLISILLFDFLNNRLSQKITNEHLRKSIIAVLLFLVSTCILILPFDALTNQGQIFMVGPLLLFLLFLNIFITIESKLLNAFEKPILKILLRILVVTVFCWIALVLNLFIYTQIKLDTSSFFQNNWNKVFLPMLLVSLALAVVVDFPITLYKTYKRIIV